MSEFMTGMSFDQLMNWIMQEQKTKGTVFGLHRCFRAEKGKINEIFGRNLETVIGPAAGPHTQLAENIVASYYAGARFFELKTVQQMDGRELAACVNKPCILAEDEGYNCEWSTELYVTEARDEYIKAWFALHVLAKEYGLGAQDGFQFNISVGYDLAGIQTPKIDGFLNDMKEAKDTEIFKECTSWLESHLDLFEKFTGEDLKAIPSAICNSATVSTLHGCPPKEIESIASYLLKEKGFNTFVKCNPTLLGYDFARETMDAMGYDYMVFGKFHFEDDLQYVDAIPMFTRLLHLAKELGLEYGVKITNTFPVDVTRQELPSEEMYMSGKALFPLSISLAAKLSGEFDGQLRIAYSGGGDAFNLERIVGCGIWPVTMATTLLKPGGYQRFTQIAENLQKTGVKPFAGINVEELNQLAEDSKKDVHHVKAAKPLPSRKIDQEVPLVDCFFAPCQEGCPIHQDIPNYVELAGQGRYADALWVILEKNPLPFITGTICAHRCMSKCTRNFYDESVNIRGTKLLVAEKAYEEVLPEITAGLPTGKKVAIVGGGPAGMAVAYFLARAGVAVTIYEKENRLGGVVARVIPEFRISQEAIGKDAGILEKLGVNVVLGTTVDSIQSLKDKGYDEIILAVGAGEPGNLKLEKGETINALSFLAEHKEKTGKIDLGENVVVIGGGNTAMDTARAAKKTEGVKHVYLVYRRTRRYMPADEQELVEALEDGVEFRELLSPVSLEGGSLLCKEMQLGSMDASGRASVEETGKTIEVPADRVIVAVGERVNTAFYESFGISVDQRGKAMINKKTMESTVPHVFVIGDGAGGPATIVEGIRDGKLAAEAILEKSVASDAPVCGEKQECYHKKGILVESKDETFESERCLNCAKVCENCVDVCPNRANVSIHVPGKTMDQILHVDDLCNECGNCKIFCPYSSAPYKAKFTLFSSEEAMKDSTNDGFVVTDSVKKEAIVRFLGKTAPCKADDPKDSLYIGLREIICAVCEDYRYLLK